MEDTSRSDHSHTLCHVSIGLYNNVYLHFLLVGRYAKTYLLIVSVMKEIFVVSYIVHALY